MSATRLDMSTTSLREVNSTLHAAKSGSFEIINPRGAHAIAACVNTDITVNVAKERSR